LRDAIGGHIDFSRQLSRAHMGRNRIQELHVSTRK
jgi:hypothetical protein